MMTAPPELPQLEIASASSNQIQIRLGTFTNYSYQLQSLGSLGGGWSNIGAAVSGNGSTAEWLLNRTNARQFYRVSVVY